MELTTRLAGSLETLGLLAALALRRPAEFRDRVEGYADLGLDRLSGVNAATAATTSWQDVARELRDRLGDDADILDEPGLAEIEDRTRRLLEGIRREDPFRPRWAADSVLARCCYLACRLLEPEIVVETGVAYGVSSAFILKALEANGRGKLHSVDLPPLRRQYRRYWGIAVPAELRGGWTLHRGSSRRVLPKVLQEVGTVDVFLHDSLHTRRNMRGEFGQVWPRLRGGGMILADDVERNDAFAGLRGRNPELWRIVRDREVTPLHGKAAPVVFGVAVK